MTASEMLKKVDHTQLKAYATWEDIVKLCDEAVAYQTASVCIPPAYVKRVHDAYKDKLKICTVVGFPLGYSVTAAKVAEVEQALREGCDEIDVVINVSDVKNGDFDKVEEDFRSLCYDGLTIEEVSQYARTREKIFENMKKTVIS